jgi:hypothetical protein
MKRAIFLALALMLSGAWGLVACSSDSGGGGDDDHAADDDAVDDDAVDDDAADDDSVDDDTVDDDSVDDDTVVSIDFEDYDLGALPAPWTTNMINSTVQVVPVSGKTVTGKALGIHGGTAVGDTGEADYPFAAPLENSISLSFDLFLFPGAYFTNAINAASSSVTFIANDAMTEMLHAQDWSGGRSPSVDCGVLLAATSVNITVDVNYAAGTYSVLIDGATSEPDPAPAFRSSSFRSRTAGKTARAET